MNKGERLNGELQSYLKQVAEPLAESIVDPLLVNNVHEQIADHLYRLMVNPSCSRVLERLIVLSTDSQVQAMFRGIEINFLDLMVDRCASHVLQALLSRMVSVSSDITSLLYDIAPLLQENWLSLSRDPHSSFVVRHFLSEELIVARGVLGLPETLADTFAELCPDDLLETVCCQPSSLVIQQLLPLRVPTLMKQLTFYSQPELAHQMLGHPCGTRVLESMLKCSDNEIFEQMLVSLLLPQISRLSKHATSNYTVQRCFENLRNSKQLKLCWDAIEGKTFVHVLMESKTRGVASKFIAAAGKFPDATIQMGVYDSVCKAFPGGIAKCLLGKQKIHVLSSLVIQGLLHFDAKIAVSIAENILTLSSSHLLNLSCDASGSRVIDLFLDLIYIPESLKVRLISRTVEANPVKLAMNKYASKVVERAVTSIIPAIKDKESVMTKLVEAENKLKGAPWGRAVWYKLKGDLFGSRPEAWIKAQGKAVLTKRMFDDFLTEDSHVERKPSIKNFNKKKKVF